MIVCAAIKLKSGIVASLPRPHRHPDIILGLQANGLTGEGEHGFVTSDGRFYNRAEAYEYAAMKGQISDGRNGGGTTCDIMLFLYSEDLW